MNWIQGLAPDAAHSPTARVTLEMDIDEQIPFYSDFPRIEIVIENLISNAIKFQDITKPIRFIRIIGKTDKDFLVLRFSDNGIGISPQYHEKIFEMFFRLASKLSGSGIGLFVVNEIVTRLNGSISLESELGRGTDILIKIPNLNNESQLNTVSEQ